MKYTTLLLNLCCLLISQYVAGDSSDGTLPLLQKQFFDFKQLQENTVRDVQRQLNEVKTALADSASQLSSTGKELQATRNQLSDTTQELNDAKYKLEVLENNTVPIDFIYIQLSNQSAPYELWPRFEWQEVTLDYSGLFFRALGGDSEQFGVVQEDAVPRVTRVEYKMDASRDGSTKDVAYNLSRGAWSDYVKTGGQYKFYDGMRFFTAKAEVRPRNIAMRIWKRNA